MKKLLTVLLVILTARPKMPPPWALSPVVLLPLTVLFVRLTASPAEIPPPVALSPAVLLPLTVLFVRLTRPRFPL